MEEQEQLKYLADKLEEEKQRHREAENREDKRHDKTVEAIKQGAGLNKTFALYEKAQTLHQERTEKLKQLEKTLRELIEEVNPYKTSKTINQIITLRDGQVKQYNETSNARLPHLESTGKSRRASKQLKQVLEDGHGEDIVKSLKELEDLDLNHRKYGTIEYYLNIEIEKEEHTNRVKTRRLEKPTINGSKHRMESNQERKIAKVIKNRKEIDDLYKKTITELEQSLEKINQIQESIQNRHSKRLTAMQL